MLKKGFWHPRPKPRLIKVWDVFRGLHDSSLMTLNGLRSHEVVGILPVIDIISSVETNDAIFKGKYLLVLDRIPNLAAPRVQTPYANSFSWSNTGCYSFCFSPLYSVDGSDFLHELIV